MKIHDYITYSSIDDLNNQADVAARNILEKTAHSAETLVVAQRIFNDYNRTYGREEAVGIFGAALLGDFFVVPGANPEDMMPWNAIAEVYLKEKRKGHLDGGSSEEKLRLGEIIQFGSELVNRVHSVPCMADSIRLSGGNVSRLSAFQEQQHPRGQPENAGEFAKKPGANKQGNTKNPKSATKKRKAASKTNSRDLYAIERYSGNSETINNSLRSGQVSPEINADIAAMDATLSKLPIYDGALYRTVFQGNDAYIAKLAALRPGDTMQDAAFSSTAKRPPMVPAGKGSASIVISNGGGRDINSVFNTNEQEVLFERNTRFVVENISKNQFGGLEITVRSVPKATESVELSGGAYNLSAFQEGQHPRGQPKNSGQFAEKPGGATNAQQPRNSVAPQKPQNNAAPAKPAQQKPAQQAGTPVSGELQKAGEFLKKCFAASGNTPEAQQGIKVAWNVVKRMNPAMLSRFMDGCKSILFLDHQGLVDKWAAMSGDREPSMGGVFVRGSGQIMVNGGEDAEGVYAHEFMHAIDKDHKISGSKEWHEAWLEEIATLHTYSIKKTIGSGDAEMEVESQISEARLSDYARESTIEGLAEFGRAVLTSTNPAGLAAKFPKCFTILRRNGLV